MKKQDQKQLMEQTKNGSISEYLFLQKLLLFKYLKIPRRISKLENQLKK